MRGKIGLVQDKSTLFLFYLLNLHAELLLTAVFIWLTKKSGMFAKTIVKQQEKVDRKRQSIRFMTEKQFHF